jgi:hypothetical protein
LSPGNAANDSSQGMSDADCTTINFRRLLDLLVELFGSQSGHAA